jgi:stearoyl-CoA desaturase (delta-9 desaturase)
MSNFLRVKGWKAADYISAVLFVAMHLAVLLVFLIPFHWSLVALAVGSYLIKMWAITAGYHRYFAHRSFKTSRVFQFFLGLLGTTTMQNGPLWWASVHRRHHKFSDTALDPHSPIYGGFWHAQVLWIFDRGMNDFDISNVNDLKVYPELRWLDAHRWIPIVGYALICFAIAGFAGVIWGFIVPTIASLHATAFINSLAHLWGSRRYLKTGDTSRNNLLLAVLCLGEGWHNNHHHYMSSARQGFFWWEIDITYYTLKVLSWLGIVWDVREPSLEARNNQ